MIQTVGRTRSLVVPAAMALPAKKVYLSVVVVILLFSAASFFLHAGSRSYGKIQSTWDDKGYEDIFRFYVNFQTPGGAGKYQPYSVLLWKHPNGEAMDDKDARRRWFRRDDDAMCLTSKELECTRTSVEKRKKVLV